MATRRKQRLDVFQAGGEDLFSHEDSLFSHYSKNNLEELLLDGDLGTKAISHLGDATWWKYELL